MLQALFYCLAWATASSSLIFLNKHLLTDDGFHYPMMLCSMGVAASWMIAAALVHTGCVLTFVHGFDIVIPPPRHTLFDLTH